MNPSITQVKSTDHLMIIDWVIEHKGYKVSLELLSKLYNIIIKHFTNILIVSDKYAYIGTC